MKEEEVVKRPIQKSVNKGIRLVLPLFSLQYLFYLKNKLLIFPHQEQKKCIYDIFSIILNGIFFRVIINRSVNMEFWVSLSNLCYIEI